MAFRKTAPSERPLRLPLYVALFLTFALAIASGSVGANADVKANQSSAAAQAAAPPGVTVTINTDDIFDSGIVFTVVSFFVAFNIVTFILATLFHPFGLTRLAFRLKAALLAFCITFIMAALIAFDVIVANRSAQVTATIGGAALPSSLVDQLQQAAGLSPVYWQNTYLRAPAIVPWFEVLFGYITAFMLFRASNRLSTTTTSTPMAAPASSGAAMTDSADATDGMTKEETPVMEEKAAQSV